MNILRYYLAFCRAMLFNTFQCSAAIIQKPLVCKRSNNLEQVATTQNKSEKAGTSQNNPEELDQPTMTHLIKGAVMYI